MTDKEPNWQSVAQLAMNQRDKLAKHTHDLEITLCLRIDELEAALKEAQAKLEAPKSKNSS